MAEPTDSSPSKKGLPEYFERVWSQALVAVSAAEDEAAKALQRMADAAGWGQDEVQKRARLFTERLIQQRKELEQAIEDGVKKSLARLRTPKREELAAIDRRLDTLLRRVAELEARKGR